MLYLLAIQCFNTFSRRYAISLALLARLASFRRACELVAQNITRGLGSSTSTGIITSTP